MGRPTGFEPATPRITILCSNQLSYGRRVSRENSRAPLPLSTSSSKTLPGPSAGGTMANHHEYGTRSSPHSEIHGKH